MRFIEAFLTTKGNVGMQFAVNSKRILTVYKDHKNEIVYSEEATEEERRILRDQYVRREHWYRSNVARARQARKARA